MNVPKFRTWILTRYSMVLIRAGRDRVSINHPDVLMINKYDIYTFLELNASTIHDILICDDPNCNWIKATTN